MAEGDEHPPERRAITELRRVVVGYEQFCAVCGRQFRSKRPAETCSQACKHKRKRQRQARQKG